MHLVNLLLHSTVVTWVQAPAVKCRHFNGICSSPEEGSSMFLLNILIHTRPFEISSPWWWRQYAPLKCRSIPTRLHGATSQKAVIVNNNIFLREFCHSGLAQPPDPLVFLFTEHTPNSPVLSFIFPLHSKSQPIQHFSHTQQKGAAICIKKNLHIRTPLPSSKYIPFLFPVCDISRIMLIRINLSRRPGWVRTAQFSP
jgi:hypothetical protein